MNYRGFSSIDGDILITTSSCIIDICIILYPILLWCQVFLNHSVPLLHGAISHQLGILSMVFTFCFTTMHNLGNLRRSCTADFVVLTPWRSRVTDPGSIKGFVQSIKHIPSYTAVCFTGQHPTSTPGPLSNLWMWLLWTYRIRDQFVFFACARRTVVIRLNLQYIFEHVQKSTIFPKITSWEKKEISIFILYYYNFCRMYQIIPFPSVLTSQLRTTISDMDICLSAHKKHWTEVGQI